jgi:hypothetical protein
MNGKPGHFAVITMIAVVLIGCVAITLGYLRSRCKKCGSRNDHWNTSAEGKKHFAWLICDKCGHTKKSETDEEWDLELNNPLADNIFFEGDHTPFD